MWLLVLENEYFGEMTMIYEEIQTKQIQMYCVDITSMAKRSSDKSGSRCFHEESTETTNQEH